VIVSVCQYVNVCVCALYVFQVWWCKSMFYVYMCVCMCVCVECVQGLTTVTRYIAQFGFIYFYSFYFVLFYFTLFYFILGYLFLFNLFYFVLFCIYCLLVLCNMYC